MTKVKTGGRVKGTPNKKTTDLFETMNRVGCDPFEVLLLFAMGDYVSLGLDPKASSNENMQDIIDNAIEGFVESGKTEKEIKEIEKALLNPISPELRQKSARDACEYLYPKRKAVEHTGKDGKDLFAERLLKAQARAEKTLVGEATQEEEGDGPSS